MAKAKTRLTVSTPADARDRLQRMQAVASRFNAWRPAAEVLTRVKSVPTRFVQIDRATRVGGWPIERIATVHGPSNHGKTSFCHGLGLSFLDGGHYYAFVDAEYTTPEAWLSELMGQQKTHPGFVALRPRSFEQTVDAVREFVETIGEAREKGDIEPDTSALIVVDSIRKLIPERLLEKILKEGAEGKKGSVDGMSGRGAMYKAALQSQWLDELVPLLARSGAGMVIITREADDPNADARDMMYDTAWKIQGSKSLVYDSSLVIRITRDEWVKEGAKDDPVIVGEKHRARIWKTKVGGKEDKHIDAHFHTSNGVGSPVGFDRARDVFELARELGIIEQRGAWFALAGGDKLGMGEAKALASLRDEGLAEVEARVRAAFTSVQSDAEGTDDVVSQSEE
jgi:RecA/RadA recombinase